MVGRIARFIGMVLGYAVYTLVVAVLLLWYLFPAATVRDWLAFRLHRAVPGVEWKIGALGLALPGRLVLRNVRLDSGGGTKAILLTLNRVTLGPDMRAMLRERKVRGLLHLDLASGSVDSRLAPAGALDRVDLQGQVRGVKIGEFGGLQARLGRKASGTLSGTFRGRIDLHNPGRDRMQADLLIEKGWLSFRKPVLGLARLPFSRIGATVVLEREKFRLEKGRLESRLLHGAFHGTLTPGRDLAGSTLLVEGMVQPRPELFARLGSNEMVRLIRSRSKKGGLEFSVTGSLAEPGILFPALAGATGDSLPGEAR